MAMNIFELFGTIAINNRDANQSLEETSSKAERTSKRIQAAFKNIGAGALKIGKMVVGGATAVGAAFTATVEGTREYRTAMAQLDTAFVTNGHTSAAAMKTYKDLQAVLGDTDQTVEAATAIALMADNEKDLSKWVDICTGVFATYQGKLPIEGLTEAANETAKVGVVTGNLADALNWAGINEDEFNLKLSACTSEQERQDLIMNTLYWTYKAAGEQYKETAKDVMAANTAQDNLNEAMAKLGAIGEPIMSGVKNWIADMVNSAVPHLDSIVTSFTNFGTTWRTEVWPAIQRDWKTNFGIELPDWDTFKADVLLKWEQIKADLADTFIVQAIIDIPKNYSQLAADIAKGWDETVLPAIKNFFKVTFGVDMPTWADIAASIAAGWDQSIYPSIMNFFKVTFGVNMPSWSEITASIRAGWESVLSSIGGLFNIDFGVNPSVTGSFGGGTSEGTGAGRTIPISSATPDGSHAGGLDRVPYDGYIARVHKDESILTKEQAAEFRSGLSPRIEALLMQIIELIRSGQIIQLDSGIMAGQLTPAIDARLGVIQGYKERGN